MTWRTATSTTLQLWCCVEKFKKVLLSGHADLVAGTTNAATTLTQVPQGGPVYPSCKHRECSCQAFHICGHDGHVHTMYCFASTGPLALSLFVFLVFFLSVFMFPFLLFFL